jgi:hypothetical protein
MLLESGAEYHHGKENNQAERKGEIKKSGKSETPLPPTRTLQGRKTEPKHNERKNVEKNWGGQTYPTPDMVQIATEQVKRILFCANFLE